MSRFLILGVSGERFELNCILHRNSGKQCVNLIRRRVLQRLYCVCTVCICPQMGCQCCLLSLLFLDVLKFFCIFCFISFNLQENFLFVLFSVLSKQRKGRKLKTS